MAPAMGLPASLIASLLLSAYAAASPGGATAEAILALDTDHSGKVERSEVESFAKAQGLSTEDVRSEFAALDTNGNGELEEDEIRSTLEHPAPAAPAAAQPAAAPAAQAAAVPAEPVPGLLMELKNVQAEAELHAGKALAEVFARTATKALEARSQDASKAEKLEKAAQALRGQTAQLRQTAAQQTFDAAAAAAESVLRESAEKVKQLESEAATAEKQAAQKRADAKEALSKAMQAQHFLQQNLNSQES